MLSIDDCCDKDSQSCLKCFSLAQAIPFLSSDDNDADSISNSGATSTIQRRQSNFVDDYQACTDGFALNGWC